MSDRFESGGHGAPMVVLEVGWRHDRDSAVEPPYTDCYRLFTYLVGFLNTLARCLSQIEDLKKSHDIVSARTENGTK